MTWKKGVGVTALALGTVGFVQAWRGSHAVVKQNTLFRRKWEYHLAGTLDHLNTTPDHQPLIYVALGDSAAQGLGADRVEEGYVPQVAAALQVMSERPVALLNLSLSGGTATSVLATQLPQLAGLRINGQPVRPDVVTLDIGGNDVNTQIAIDLFENQMQTIVESIDAPLFMVDLPTYHPLPVADRADAMNDVLVRVATAHDVPITQLHELSQSFSVPQYMLDYHAGDLFHPNSPWYAVWAQQVIDRISHRFGWTTVDVTTLPDFELTRYAG